jgi:two-component system CheB/CheR fusion protein
VEEDRAESKAEEPRSQVAEPRPGRARAPIGVVGMGGSAGGLEAFEQFFSHLPPDTGLAFVLVPHLEPTHKGMMPELLQRYTRMQVVEVADGMEVQPNRVYVIPPNADLSILHGKLQVLEPVAPRGLRTPIDYFFRHLAMDQKEKAIAILLSGMGSDGTLGLKAIKENVGLAMVQDPASAQFDAMPRNAIATGLVDYVAPADELPAKLVQYILHTRPAIEDRDLPAAEPSAALRKVFVLLRARTGNDFSCYKNTTICRRIERRMSVHQFDSLPRYVRFLQENPQEVDLLHKELLIGVTNCFRDSGLFEVLKEKVIPRLLRDRPKGNPLRVWNPGCSTGEETYSLAIVLKECMEELGNKGVGNLLPERPEGCCAQKVPDPFVPPGNLLPERPEGCCAQKVPDPFLPPAIQVFATDIDQDAIDKAGKGVFAAGIAADVSAQRLARFFVPEGDGYRIKREIRDLVVFGVQNILIDPPFTKLDILCCRNLLIYVNLETQKKLLPLMHYALAPGGLLILGTAETVGGFDRLFAPVDRKWKVFQRQEVGERTFVELPGRARRTGRGSPPFMEKAKEPVMDVCYAAQRVLLDRYGPPAVIVTAEGDVIYVNGRTGKYLEPSSGKANINVFAMAREGLREELAIAIHKAAKAKTAVTQRGVRVKTNGGFTTIDLAVTPLVEPGDLSGTFFVVFAEAAAGSGAPPAARTPAPAGPGAAAPEVEEELRRTRERLQTTVEEMQVTHEELRSTNEELQSNNEELQTANEELTSSKEELQSLNEEMQTVNAELQSKIDELSRSNSDMKNLLNGIEMATIFLDNSLAVKRFSAQATKIVNLVPGDTGRPIGDFAPKLKYDRLLEDAQDVLETLVPKEAQVQATDGRWYHMRILPYRTLDNVIDGVVMTFADTTALKQTEARLQEARDYAQSIIATIREPLVVLDGELRIVSASRSFYQTFAIEPAETEGQLLYEIGGRQWDIAALRQLLEDIVPKNTEFQDFRMEHDFPGIGHKSLLLNARRIEPRDQGGSLILLAIEEIGERPIEGGQRGMKP